ncbi:hypothetical protein CTEN210_13248 [Chaetoceros tenuissimus]|uniref:ShKT domain-containing protein n=1 Tax=Chaetoceros tenuissimus TaxID=426638 RepID=A0AAD3D2Q0_9STRA|nr:hypothetical protein CTEN210_13248 [Chaetoceros tenuissimus]
MKLALLKAFLAIQVCQVVQATDDHADNLTSRVSKTLAKQFKTMKNHPVNVKSIHALQKKKKNFKSLHRNLQVSCFFDLYKISNIFGDFYELDVYQNGFTILPDFSAYTWIGDESDLTELSDACADLDYLDLGGSISFLDMNVEGDQCEYLPMVYIPRCIPYSCTMEEALEVLNPVDDDDCSFEYVLSEGPPEITDSCFTYVYNIVVAKYFLFSVRYLYGFYTEFDNLEYYYDLGFGFGGDVDKILTNFTDTCEEMDASVYFTKGETNGKCFSEDYYGNQTEAEGWDVLPECIPNKCTQEEALEAYKTFYSMEFESQPECVLELEYTFPPDSSEAPSSGPTSLSSENPSMSSDKPSLSPSSVLSDNPLDSSEAPSSGHTSLSSEFPSMSSDKPSLSPSSVPSDNPLDSSEAPSSGPTSLSSESPSMSSDKPSLSPSSVPSDNPSDDETPEESPPSPPSPDGPSSKAPKSMKSFKSTKSSNVPKMVKMPKMPKTVKMPKMVKMAKAAKDEYKEATEATTCSNIGSFKFELAKKGDLKHCSWLTKNAANVDTRRNNYCNQTHVGAACQKSCAKCNMYADNPNFTFERKKPDEKGNTVMLDCAWITQNQKAVETRLDTYCFVDCNKASDVGDACPVACGFTEGLHWNKKC